MRVKATDIGYDKWPDIITAAGMAQEYFSGKHSACPFCGGVDRYRWDKKNGGRWLCNHCTEGRYQSGISLLMRHLGHAQFIDTARYVEQYHGAGFNPQDTAVRRDFTVAAEKADSSKAFAKAMSIWSTAKSVEVDDPVWRYLHRRVPRVVEIPSDVRHHPALEYWQVENGEFRSLGKYPAMLVRGFNAKGEVVQLHKTYLTQEGEKAPVPTVKKVAPIAGVNAFALRLGKPSGDVLGVCEGIETAFASSALNDQSSQKGLHLCGFRRQRPKRETGRSSGCGRAGLTPQAAANQVADS
jgi:putative DNA primase/helicase